LREAKEHGGSGFGGGDDGPSEAVQQRVGDVEGQRLEHGQDRLASGLTGQTRIRWILTRATALSAPGAGQRIAQVPEDQTPRRAKEVGGPSHSRREDWATPPQRATRIGSGGAAADANLWNERGVPLLSRRYSLRFSP
jgi:hypothetical protein